MNKRSLSLLTCLVTTSLLLSGCWDHEELPEFGFVQAVAIDLHEGDEGKIDLTTQFIKPSPKIGSAGGGGDKAFFNIETTGDSVFEAIRDIATHLGRKAQWSHTRIILISEELAKERNVGEILEFFYRDHEPRLMISIAIMEGKAKDYLENKPFIENTISQQLKEIETSSFKYNSKSIDINLLIFGRELKSETATAKLPYYKFSSTGEPIVYGITYLQKGKLTGHLSPRETESLLKLMNEAQSGIIEVPCEGSKTKLKESIEINHVETSIKPTLSKTNDVSVKVDISMLGDIGELKCTNIDTTEKINKYNKKVAGVVKKAVNKTLTDLQEDKVDLIGIGNEIYRDNPKQWKKIKAEWPEIFSQAKFQVNVEMDIGNSGSDIGRAFFD
ncbi:Ger(x)C family spore germination protein [Guptibacillus algicola]|uniref:Ger(x)C family spore germination protein n=1 Tax=Guptibacillus algicola TaxID=225844 RepID=UPI001CD7E375|nr:Ger(x)C family spore germination protein [Alkalihalobacillus algicola]MCA0988357.1 Ger(x)C family spore germination protein [Alkalihalobacillus algicola]